MSEKVSIFGPTISRTFGYTFGHFGTILKAAGIPMVLMTGIFVYFYLPTLVTFSEAANQAEQMDDPTLILQSMGSFFGVLSLVLLVSLIVYPMIATSILRNIIFGTPTSFITLDSGVFRLLGTMIVIGLIWMAGGLLIMIALGILAAIFISMKFYVGLVLVYIGVLVAMFYLLAKTSLILPDVVASGEFRIAEGWRLTDGYVWPLVGTFIVISIIGTIISYIFMAAAIIVGGIGVESSGFSEAMSSGSDTAIFEALVSLTQSPLGFLAMLIYSMSMVVGVGINFGSIGFAYQILSNPSSEGPSAEN